MAFNIIDLNIILNKFLFCITVTDRQKDRWSKAMIPRFLSAYDATSFLCFFCFYRYRCQSLALKGCVMCLQQLKNPSLNFGLLYSLWHKQTSTYALLHINVPDILQCLTDALSLPQTLSEGMVSRLCQFPILCQDSEMWNKF